MDRQNEPHLKNLLQALPQGFVVDSAWLKSQNISRQSMSQYVKRGWLERLKQGVYRRPFTHGRNLDEMPEWEILVLSLQRIMGCSLHLGGATALRRKGFGHYLPLGGEEPIYLYGDDFPTWLKSLPVHAALRLRSRSLFNPPEAGIESNPAELGDTRSEPPWRWSMVASPPERAILEALDELPDGESFHTIDMMFQSLANLSPRRMAALLASCRKIKVVRLFFVFADRHGHAWRKHLKEDEINFGIGDRALVSGGKLHPKYRITVPPEFVLPREEERDGA